MLFEFVITPDVIEDAMTSPNISDQLPIVELLKRLRENGMLIDLRNGEWKNSIYELLYEIDGGYLSDIMTLFEELDRHYRIVPHPSSSSPPPIDWIAEAAFVNSLCAFNGVMLGHSSYSKLGSPSAYHYLFPGVPSAHWPQWYGKRSRNVKKCERDFRDVLAPVLRHATRVDLVDPYFSCHRDEYTRTIKLCIDLLMNGANDSPQLVIHAGDPQKGNQSESINKRKAAWNVFFTSLSLPRSMTFRVFLWGDMHPERPHNRYIFTDQHVGISAPHGLDCYDLASASTDSWDLKDVDVTQDLLQNYTSAPIYRKLGEVTVKYS